MYKSGYNLELEAINFINERNIITLLSPYIKLPQLIKLNKRNNIKEIVVRWDVQDLCLGVSDIELYEYCKQQKITLYRNTRIHLKAIWDNKDSVFFGSANISGRGIGEQGKFNYELNSANNDLTIEDRLYFRRIINSSELVDDELYLKLKLLKEKFETKKIEYPNLDNIHIKSKFLLSQLPMSINPSFLLDGFYGNQKLPNHDEEFLIHDLSTYKINTRLDRQEMEDQLKTNFNSHPFIMAIKEYIKNSDSKSMNYGSVVRWIQSNTTTVPTPRSWEMKREKIVNILYDWICFLMIISTGIDLIIHR